MAAKRVRIRCDVPVDIEIAFSNSGSSLNSAMKRLRTASRWATSRSISSGEQRASCTAHVSNSGMLIRLRAAPDR